METFFYCPIQKQSIYVRFHLLYHFPNLNFEIESKTLIIIIIIHLDHSQQIFQIEYLCSSIVKKFDNSSNLPSPLYPLSPPLGFRFSLLAKNSILHAQAGDRSQGVVEAQSRYSRCVVETQLRQSRDEAEARSVLRALLRVS